MIKKELSDADMELIASMAEGLVTDFAKSIDEFKAAAKAADAEMPEEKIEEMQLAFWSALHLAGARVGKEMGIPYLFNVVRAACGGSEVYNLTDGDESLHQMMHRMGEKFDSGNLSGIQFMGGNMKLDNPAILKMFLSGQGERPPPEVIQRIIEAINGIVGIGDAKVHVEGMDSPFHPPQAKVRKEDLN